MHAAHATHSATSPIRRYLRRAEFLFLLVIAWLAASPMMRGQTTSSIEGTIKDEQGLAITGAEVHARNDALAIDRSAVSDSSGSYRIAGLPPGIYTVAAAKSGFATQSLPNLQITVDTTIATNFVLKVGTTTQSVEVTSAPLLLETTSSSTSSIITPEQIEDMPLNGRNYLDLLELVPGVSLNRQIDPSEDAAAPILGERGGNASFLIDGMPNSDEVNGGPASQFNQDSILEFQVVTSSYKAEFGHGSGGIVNVVSKSGTNSYHGGGSFFYRNYELDSPDISSESKAPFELREDPSVQIGGPIIKDKVFFFASAERIDESRELNFQFPPGVPQFIETSEDTYDRHSLTYDTRLRGKIDEQLAHHRLTEQVNYTNSHVTDFLPLEEATNLPSTREDIGSRHLMVGVSDTATLGDQSSPWLLVWYGQYRGEPTLLSPAHPQVGPQATADNLFSSLNTGGLGGDLGFVQVGPGFTPLTLKQQYGSFGANLAKQFGRHTWKFGWDFQRTIANGTESSNLYEQLFSTIAAQQEFGFQQSGTYVLDVQTNTPSALNIKLRDNYNGLFAQDDWKIAKTLTLNLGVRWDYDSEFPNKTNFSPRLGLAWAINPKTVIRGSFGVFYDHFRVGLARDIPGFGGADITRTRYYSFPQLFYGNPSTLTEHFASIFATPCASSNMTDAQIAAAGATCPVTGPSGQTLPYFGIDYLNNVVATGHAPIPANTPVNTGNVQALTGLTPAQFATAASLAVDQPANFFSYDPFGNLTSLALAVPGLSTPITVSPGFKTPYNRTYYAGVQRELTHDTVLTVDYYHRDIRNVLGVRNTNLAFQARLPGNTLELQPGTGDQIIQGFGPWYSGRFNGVTVGVNKRMSHRFTLAASYTWINDTDNALNANFTTNFQTQGGAHFADSTFGPTDSYVGIVPLVNDTVDGKTNANGPFITGDGIPQDGGNPVPKAGTFYNGANLDKGPSGLALNHTFEIHGVLDLPWKFEFSDIFRAQSGFHYSAGFISGDDVDGDGLFNGIDWTQGRNHFTASPYVNMDARIAKRFDFKERYRLFLYFEMFNLLNRANPAAVEQLPLQPSPFGSTIQVLPGREGQVGVRFEF